jgi:hypothetical protein
MANDAPNGRPRVYSGVRLAWSMLSGVTSSLRCQDFLDRGDLGCAQVELLALRQSLAALEGATLDATSDEELELLRARAEQLALRLQSKRTGTH